MRVRSSGVVSQVLPRERVVSVSPTATFSGASAAPMVPSLAVRLALPVVTRFSPSELAFVSSGLPPVTVRSMLPP